MRVLTAEEYKAIKKQRNISIPDLAYTMKRSVAVVTKIKNTKNFEEYKQLVKAEHLPSKKRKKTLGQRVTELEQIVKELENKKGWLRKWQR